MYNDPSDISGVSWNIPMIANLLSLVQDYFVGYQIHDKRTRAIYPSPIDSDHSTTLPVWLQLRSVFFILVNLQWAVYSRFKLEQGIFRHANRYVVLFSRNIHDPRTSVIQQEKGIVFWMSKSKIDYSKILHSIFWAVSNPTELRIRINSPKPSSLIRILEVLLADCTGEVDSSFRRRL